MFRIQPIEKSPDSEGLDAAPSLYRPDALQLSARHRVNSNA